jgi:hypothetical protein
MTVRLSITVTLEPRNGVAALRRVLGQSIRAGRFEPAGAP